MPADSGNHEAGRAESGRDRERMATPGNQPVRGAERRNCVHRRDAQQAAQSGRREVGPLLQIERGGQRGRAELDEPQGERAGHQHQIPEPPRRGERHSEQPRAGEREQCHHHLDRCPERGGAERHPLQGDRSDESDRREQEHRQPAQPTAGGEDTVGRRPDSIVQRSITSPGVATRRGLRPILPHVAPKAFVANPSLNLIISHQRAAIHRLSVGSIKPRL